MRRVVDIRALHGLAVVLLPMATTALFKRDFAQASVITPAYALAAYISTHGYADLPEVFASGLVTGLQASSIVFTATYFYNVQREPGVEEEPKRRLGGQEPPCFT